jgi:hypothetical protein
MFKYLRKAAASAATDLSMAVQQRRLMQRLYYGSGVRTYAAGPMRRTTHVTAKMHRPIPCWGTAYEDGAARPQRLLKLKQRAERRAAR